MKTFVLLTLAFAMSGCAFAQSSTTGVEWNVTLKVVDDNGQPVQGARVSVGYHVTPPPGQIIEDYRDSSDKIEGQTDANGEFTASHSDASWSLGIDVQKAGCYPSHINYNLFIPGQFDAQTVAKNRNPTLTLVLKKILHPIPMYAKRIIGMPPIFGRPLGYDFIVGDWVAPYGKGTNAYIFFTARKIANDTEFVVTFPNPDDGIQEYHVPYPLTQGSALRSPHEAPKGGYESELTRTSKDYNEDRCYFFRVRTASGTGILYGKIYGDPMNFCYYLNPTPNSRNIEFDPKENLIKKFRLVAERVTAP